MARWYIGGLLAHAPAVLAFSNPTMNSYHRLVPGYEAPVNLVYSQRNRSACIRIPITGSVAKAKRIEFRVPDPSCNPYLAFSAMLMAGLDGSRTRSSRWPRSTRTSTSCRRRSRRHPAGPGLAGGRPRRLESDHDFLTEGGVFTDDLIETWVDFKRANEVAPIRLRPHPTSSRCTTTSDRIPTARCCPPRGPVDRGSIGVRLASEGPGPPGRGLQGVVRGGNSHQVRHEVPSRRARLPNSAETSGAFSNRLQHDAIPLRKPEQSRPGLLVCAFGLDIERRAGWR